jgi:dihydrofolate reductase
MRKVMAIISLSLDGVMQAPGRPDEDTRGGFEYGGWANAYRDQVMGQTMGKGMSRGADLLFGRRTYEDFYDVWPKRTESPFCAVLNRSQKYVASRSLRDPLPWENSTLLSGDAADTVARLKAQPGLDLVILGCGDLLQTLMRHRLVDSYALLIHPIVFGHGRRLFNEGLPHATLRLTDSVTTTGVMIATYEHN